MFTEADAVVAFEGRASCDLDDSDSRVFIGRVRSNYDDLEFYALRFNKGIDGLINETVFVVTYDNTNLHDAHSS